MLATLTAGCGLAALAGMAASEEAGSPELAFSAQVDKTTVAVGETLQLSLTVSGDTTGVTLPPPEMPEGLVIVAQSQATNFTLRAGQSQRSVSLTYVLAARRAGTYNLGPFALTHGRQTITTEPIAVTVTTPTGPPKSGGSVERFTL